MGFSYVNRFVFPHNVLRFSTFSVVSMDAVIVYYFRLSRILFSSLRTQHIHFITWSGLLDLIEYFLHLSVHSFIFDVVDTYFFFLSFSVSRSFFPDNWIKRWTGLFVFKIYRIKVICSTSFLRLLFTEFGTLYVFSRERCTVFHYFLSCYHPYFV